MRPRSHSRLNPKRVAPPLLFLAVIACGAPKGVMESKTFIPKEERSSAASQAAQNPTSKITTNPSQDDTKNNEDPPPATKNDPDGDKVVKDDVNPSVDGNDEEVDPPNLTEEIVGEILAVAPEPVAKDSIFSVQTPTSYWLISPDSKTTTAAFDYSSMKKVSGTSPCATLPRLSVEYSQTLLPSGDLDCWSIDKDQIIVIKHLPEQNGDSGNAFEMTKVKWSEIKPDFKAAEFSSYSILGLSGANVVMGSQGELLILGATAGRVNITSLDLQPLKLEHAPDSAVAERIQAKRHIRLSHGEDLYFAEETAENSQTFEWRKISAKLTVSSGFSGGSLDLISPNKKIILHSNQLDTSKSSLTAFLSMNEKLYQLKLGEISQRHSEPEVAWPGLNFLNKYCKNCHTAPNGSDNVNLMLANGKPNETYLKENYTTIMTAINSGRMPNYGPKPNVSEIKEFDKALKEL